MSAMTFSSLFGKNLKVVNVGIADFAENIRRSGGSVVGVEWRPPADLASSVRDVLAAKNDLIQKANAEALRRILEGKPAWVGMGRAMDVVPGMRKNLILHAGPPITWERMCGPMRGAVVGALIYEGLAQTPEDAEVLAASGKIDFEPCHEHQSVGPMAGVTSASMPVFVVRNEAFGNVAFCTQNEGLGKVLRYGAFSPEVVERLRWMENTLYPTLKKAIDTIGKVDLKSIIAQALHMGDELHNRNRAGTSLFYRAIAPAIVETAPSPKIAADVLRFINGNDHFFLNLSMAASKATLDAARDIENSSVAVVMARNGTDFGIQLAGTGAQWFTGPALVPDALFFAGFTKEDANPDIGDSAITETNGLGGFAIAASPAIVQFVGGQASDARQYTLDMYEITVGENTAYQIPSLDFRGTPTGIDAVRVVESGTLPFIDTGVAHKNAGVGQVGAGVLKAPMEPFVKASEALAETFKSTGAFWEECQ
jgi:hypothetical protein